MEDFEHLRHSLSVALLFLVDDVLLDEVGQCTGVLPLGSVEVVQAIDSFVEHFGSRFRVFQVVVQRDQCRHLKDSSTLGGTPRGESSLRCLA